jgi:signal transduction histidine kinase
MVVQDTGVGMDQQTMEQIFLPFFTTKDLDQGTGLGLSVVHGIVSAHEGTIDVESKVGKGTIFTLTFPAYKEIDQ